MKMFRKLALGLLLICAASLTGATTVMAQSRMYGSYPSFYDELSPYGRWTESREYGQVWIPNVERGFQPYATRGHWAMTEYGNTWVSDYDWGWAPFHYGRWTFDDYYNNWIWIPGNEWAPAWVSWRSDNDNYGWAPLGPGVDINVNISIPLERWIFVPKRYIVQRNVYDYCLPPQRVIYVYRNTVVINNIYVNGGRRYSSGPYRDDIERYTRQRVNVYRVENNGRPGRMEERDGTLRIYRPEPSGRGERNSRDEHRLSDYRTRDTGTDRIPDRRNGNYSSQRREYPSNSGKENERTANQDRNRSQDERYSRQNQQQNRVRPDGASEHRGSNREAQSDQSDSRTQRPVEGQRGSSTPSIPSGQRTRPNSGGRSSNESNNSSADQGNSAGRGRPTRG